MPQSDPEEIAADDDWQADYERFDELDDAVVLEECEECGVELGQLEDGVCDRCADEEEDDD